MQDKVTTTIAGVSTDYFPQSYTDAAVAAALAAVPNASGPTITEVKVEESDGTEKVVTA